jgi:hypothetical protein
MASRFIKAPKLTSKPKVAAEPCRSNKDKIKKYLMTLYSKQKNKFQDLFEHKNESFLLISSMRKTIL